MFRKTIHIISRLFFIATVLVFIFYIGLYFLQDKFFYNPHLDKDCYNYLMDTNTYTEVKINIKDTICSGLKKISNKKSLKKEKNAILLFDGRGECAAHTFYEYDKNNNWNYYTGYDFIIIDYPGYGHSQGTPSYKKVLKMAEESYTTISSEYNNVIVMGYSLGTGVATYIANKFTPQKLILVSPYTNGFDINDYTVKIIPNRWKSYITNEFPSDKYATKINIPTLIIATTSDSIVPYKQSLELSKKFSNCKFVTTGKYHHNNMLYEKENLKYIKEFL